LWGYEKHGCSPRIALLAVHGKIRLSIYINGRVPFARKILYLFQAFGNIPVEYRSREFTKACAEELKMVLLDELRYFGTRFLMVQEFNEGKKQEHEMSRRKQKGFVEG
jgi:hypothetical protein